MARCTQTRRQSPTGPLHVFFFNICLCCFPLRSSAIKSMCSVPWPQTSGPHFADGRLKPLQYLGMPWQGQKEGIRPKTNLRTTKDDKACCCFSSAFCLQSVTGPSAMQRSRTGDWSLEPKVNFRSKPISKCSAQRAKPKTNHM